MAKKSRQRKIQGNRPPEALTGKTAPINHATYKPWQIAAVCALLAVITLLVYQGVRSNDFLRYDDDYYVLENRQVQQGINAQTITWAFTTFNQGNWHPLAWISHMIDWDLYGNKPAGHHMTNVCLHAANTILLFLLLFYMTGFIGRSAMVALLFALHPAHVESVAWVAERKDVLCAFFYLATLLAYAWYVRSPSWKRYLLVVFGFACALMSKPMAVTLPAILLLLDYWPLRRITLAPETRSQWLSSLWKQCIEKWPLFIMAIASSVVTFIAQRAGGSVAALQGLSLWARLSTSAICYCRYLRITFWPNPLTAYYYYDLDNINILAAVLSAIAIILVTALCWRFRNEKPYCLIGWLWFLITLLPVIGIVQVGEQAMAERYSYIPLIGLFIAVIWLAGDAVAHFPKLKIAAQLLAVAVIAACALKTYAQVKVWKDTMTLFTHALDVDPRGALPNLTLGVAYEREGNYAEAEKYFECSLTYNPTAPLALCDSALCLMQTRDQRNLQLAGQRLEEALSVAPDNPDILTNMAIWDGLAGRPKDEETYTRKVIASYPNFINNIAARLYLADALRAQNRLEESAAECRKVLAIDPNNYLAHYNLGVLLEMQGLHQEAVNEFRLSLAIKPDQAMAHFKIGKIFIDSHQSAQAMEEFNRALEIDPTIASAHNGIGVVLYQQGDYQKAAEQFSEAARLDPSFIDARRNYELAQSQIKSK